MKSIKLTNSQVETILNSMAFAHHEIHDVLEDPPLTKDQSRYLKKEIHKLHRLMHDFRKYLNV